ncbi:MAG: hypothetical protein V2I67_02850, partial [Thermoanaerobaculales bacterium]|nr:hypothetical protein [Thermoanaerobaculales bacterium]
MRSAIKRWVWVLCCGALAGTPVVAAEKPESVPAEPITGDAIRLHTTVLGSDAMEGRAPGSVGGRRAAGYLRQILEAKGVQPFGDDGGYDQRVPLHASLALEESRFEIWNLGTTRRLRLGDDYLL